MDKQIRAAIKDRLKALGMTNADVAKTLDITPQAVGQLVNGDRGKIPDSLLGLLHAIGLELTVKEVSNG